MHVVIKLLLNLKLRNSKETVESAMGFSAVFKIQRKFGRIESTTTLHNRIFENLKHIYFPRALKK